MRDIKFMKPTAEQIEAIKAKAEMERIFQPVMEKLKANGRMISFDSQKQS